MNSLALLYAAGARTGSPVAKAVLYTLATMVDPETPIFGDEPLWGINLHPADLTFLARTVEADTGMVVDVLRRMRESMPMEVIEHHGKAAKEHGLFEVVFGPGYSPTHMIPMQYIHRDEEQIICCMSCQSCRTAPFTGL